MKTNTLQSLQAINAATITELHAHHKGVRKALSSLIEYNFSVRDKPEAETADCTYWAKENATAKRNLKRLADIQRYIKADISAARTSKRPSKKHALGAPHPSPSKASAQELVQEPA